MKIGLSFVNSGPGAEPEYAAESAAVAERRGVESLWTVEHVVVPAGYESEYPYSRSGKMPGGEDVPIPDPLVWLAYVAGATERITLATGILILPQRNPVVLAKECATLDRLSGGRFVLGIGVGWLAEEFAIIGIPFDERAERTDEAVGALRALWEQDEPSFSGRFFSFSGAKSYPKPARPIPVVVGGHSVAAARRAGRIGDGFFPARVSPDTLDPLLREMRAAAEAAGRDPDAIEVTVGGRPDPDAVQAFARLGVTRYVIAPPAYGIAELDEALSSLVPALAG